MDKEICLREYCWIAFDAENSWKHADFPSELEAIGGFLDVFSSVFHHEGGKELVDEEVLGNWHQWRWSPIKGRANWRFF